MPKYKILKLKADKIIEYGVQKDEEENGEKVEYQIDLNTNVTYRAVVEEQLLMEECALFDQFQFLLKMYDTEEIREWLLNELVIVDFTNIYKGKSKVQEEQIENLITDGFYMSYKGKNVHMLPFDKSGNMSRKCRLSFINAEHIDEMNERLNLGMNFTRIPVKLSKYYAYRGLYLSTAKRISNERIKITSETLVVIKDNIQEADQYQKEVWIKSGIVDDNDKSQITFDTTKVEKEKITIPFDGQGIVCPDYAKHIRESLENKEIHSFQIRLPFTKGMLHCVDFHGFFDEMDEKYKEGPYEIEDAFGKLRDLKKAKIIVTKSMFKCFDWVKSHCADEEDPMKFYCDALEKYQHGLYVSSTDLPYGHSRVTHISYQLLNTLALSEEQFQSLINKQLAYIHNPITYIEMCKGQPVNDDDGDAIDYEFPNWQRALLINPYFGHLKYVKQQLKSMQTALMTKLALGKLVVKGQMRYMTRDLPYMLVNLIKDDDKRIELKNFKIFGYRFYLPQGKEGKNEMDLDYYTYCAFFRSPHLSRNEQGLLAPVVLGENSEEAYRNQFQTFNKYFENLTGVVMFGNESLEPMALGGADFDGDLVSMIMDEDIVDAIKKSLYTEPNIGPLDIYRKDTIPYVKIPTMKSDEVTVPRTIPYKQIKDTFSNKIGLISNAAIAIAQSEYGTKKNENLGITCSDCTILTGLEIDAAKNGVHPDLSMIENNESLTTCNYLKFKKEFENLKKDENYHFNQLKMKIDKGHYILQIKGRNTKIKYTEEKGTYINKLPIIFMENLNPKLELPEVKIKKYFCFPKVEVSEEKIDIFTEQCTQIIETYLYFSDLFKHIRDKEKKNFKNTSNLEKLIRKQYDEDRAEQIIREEIPSLCNVFAKKISDYSAFKMVENYINEKQWHFMTTERRKEFLCDLLQVEDICEEEWQVVLQPYNHGYKVLWYIVQDVSNMLSTYKDYKIEFHEKTSELEQLHTFIAEEANILLRNYVEKKESFSIAKIYAISLDALRNMVEAFEIPDSKKIEILFNLTKSEGKKSRFFWDCFDWKELEPYIVKENDDAE